MGKLSYQKIAVILVHGLIGWALCGAVIWIGMAVTSMEATLIAHAIGAPIIFGLISFIYYRAFSYTSPLVTAVAFLAVVIFMDVFVVALLIERSFDMFTGLIGTWIPWVLILASTYLMGLLAARRAAAAAIS